MFLQDSDNKKLDKKESTGPPLQTASVSVRALIEEKIISRRGATATCTSSTGMYSLLINIENFIKSALTDNDRSFNFHLLFLGTVTDTVVSRSGFVAPAPPPLSTIRTSIGSPASPAATSGHFVPPRAPSVVTVASNVATNITAANRDSALIELLKKGNSKVSNLFAYCADESYCSEF